MCIADDPLAVGAEKAVLAVLQRHQQVWAKVAIDPHFTPVAQGEQAVRPLAMRVKAPCLVFAQLIEPA
ncbi:hypothetical protein D3C81_2281790 [compost metagenome]